MKAYRLKPTSLSLLDETDKKLPLDNYLRMFMRSERATVWIVREPIRGTDKTTFNVYTDVQPTVPAQRVDDFELPVVLHEYDKSLLMQKVGAVGPQTEVAVEIDHTKDAQEARKAVALAGLENVKLFAGRFGRAVSGAVDPADYKPDTFYGTTVFLHNVHPLYVMPNVLASRQLNYDVMQIRVRVSDVKGSALLRLKGTEHQGAAYSMDAAKEEQKTEKLQAEMAAGATLPYDVSVTYTVFGKTIADMQRRLELLTDRLAMILQSTTAYDRPKYVQKDLYVHGMPAPRWKKRAITNLSSLAAFYPFNAAEMLDPDGVFIGTNAQTLSPVLYDVDAASMNKHHVVLGATGSGKSLHVKNLVWLTVERARQTGQEEPIITILDPSKEHEYRPLAGDLGIPYLVMRDGIGVEPMQFETAFAVGVLGPLFKLSKEQSDLLYRIVEQFQSDNGVQADKRRTTYLEDYARRYLETSGRPVGDVERSLLDALHVGAQRYGNMFAGTFPDGSFALSVHDAIDEQAVIAVTALVMRRISQAYAAMPRSRLKIVVMDEVWKLLNDPVTGEAVRRIVKEDRKSNTALFAITQDTHDLKTDIGQAVIRNAEAKFIFANDGLADVKELLSLSDVEVQSVKPSKAEIPKGLCVLIRGGMHILMQTNVPTDRLARYSTDPRDYAGR